MRGDSTVGSPLPKRKGVIMDNNVVLTMRGICMTFPGVKALDHVDFTLRKGEIHALMGENGAGKSTLIKCLTGINAFEAGEIRVDGIDGPVVNHSTLDAQKKRNLHGVSGSKPLPEFERGGKSVYRPGAEDKNRNHRLENHGQEIPENHAGS